MIAKHTKSLRIVKRVLYVEVDSAALRNELTYLREKIKKKLNKKAGDNLIDEVIIR
jgi:predicted nucleic acid-binding Zn ribbon protein